MLSRLSLLCVSLLATALAAVPSALAQKQEVIEVSTRPGQRVRALLLKPANPIGSVILLAGGHGNLALGADGTIGWGKGNQLVRTRADYAKAGFVTLVPDIAQDHKRGSGGVPRYRWSPTLATDIGFLVKHLRGVAAPVYLVGTSRAALSVGAAATRLTGPARPDAVVITSGMLMRISDKQPSVQQNVPNLGRITEPTLLMYHENDGCPYTPASSAARFKPLLTGTKRVDITILKGGSAGRGDPCEAHTHHGYEGQDAEVVAAVTRWLKAVPKP